MDGWWVSDVMNGLANGKVVLTSWIVWVAVSISLHELGHGWMAIRCGDRTPIDSQHMTINPFVHIPPMAWIMFALFGFTWGLMPVNPSRFRGRYDDAKVAIAGPAVNLILWVLCVALDVLWLKVGSRVGGPMELNLHTFLYVGAMINLMGFVFNLIPVPPLDGSRILADFYPPFNRIWQTGAGTFIAIVAAIALFSVGGRIAWGLAESGSLWAIGFGCDAFKAEWMPPFIR
jgi:Zn-dependent protease